MNSATDILHDQKVDSLAIKYEQDGYLVFKKPSAEILPFDLGGYHPDLMAVKDRGGLMIEVKTSPAPVSIDRFQSLAQQISEHDGWRLLLVTLDDIDSRKIPTSDSELPTWPQLADKVQQVEGLVENGLLEPAILFLWSVFEAAMRKQAIADNIPIERLPEPKLLNYMYSQGEVSVDHLDVFRNFMNTRDRVAHGANEQIDPAMMSGSIRAVRELLNDWTTGGAVTFQGPRKTTRYATSHGGES